MVILYTHKKTKYLVDIQSEKTKKTERHTEKGNVKIWDCTSWRVLAETAAFLSTAKIAFTGSTIFSNCDNRICRLFCNVVTPVFGREVCTATWTKAAKQFANIKIWNYLWKWCKTKVVWKELTGDWTISH